MHKDTIVALCKDNKTIKVFNETFLPKGIQSEGKSYSLKHWLEERKIPEDRKYYKKIEMTFINLGIDINYAHFLNYGLSLTDNYWFYQVEDNIISVLSKLKLKKYEKEIPKYSEINYYENEFNENFMQNIIYRKNVEEKNLLTPDMTTNGVNQKYWVIRNGKRILAKQNDTIFNYVAEKEILASFVAYMINQCRHTSKKKVIDCVNYQFEKGKTEYENVCFAENFTSLDEELVTYSQLTGYKTLNSDEEKLKQLEQFKEKYKNNVSIQDYLDFLIVLDFLTENERKEEDIGFLMSSSSMLILKPAPVYGNCNAFGYMKKDFTRASHELYSGHYKNVFGMNDVAQCRYISRLDWMLPDLLYRECDTFAKYLFSDDMVSFPRQYKENIVNWLKYRIVMIANEKKQNLIEEAMNAENSEEKEYEGIDVISQST